MTHISPKSYDLVIVGAGPSGTTCAYQLKDSGLKIAIIDKEVFPRDKICGDVLSADVMNQLIMIDSSVADGFDQMTAKQPSRGIRFVAPSFELLDIPFTLPKNGGSPSFIAKRFDFDNYLFNQIKDQPNIDIYQGVKIDDIINSNGRVIIKSKDQVFHAKMIAGSDGANSVVSRKLANSKIERKHHMAGLRRYYKNVSGMHVDSHIELHFYEETLPGYLWIFALPNGEANVGLGIRSDVVSKKKINLKELLDDMIANHPNLKDRFVNAEPLETTKGFGLPSGSKKRVISGDKFLLLGDAASLIDPFTGEGIGNAIRSGRVAADHVLDAFKQNRFDAQFNKAYDKEIYRRMWNELRISRFLQKLERFPKLFSYIIRRANSNASLRQLMTSMLDNIDIRNELTKPSFYWKLLFS